MAFDLQRPALFGDAVMAIAMILLAAGAVLFLTAAPLGTVNASASLVLGWLSPLVAGLSV